MSICSILPILIGLGGLFFGGLTAWAWCRDRLNKLSEKCQTVEADNVVLWNSYTSLQSEFTRFKEEIATGRGELEDQVGKQPAVAKEATEE